jgi:hypothetical protein
MGAWVAQLLVGQRVVGLSVPRLPVRAALVVSVLATVAVTALVLKLLAPKD